MKKITRYRSNVLSMQLIVAVIAFFTFSLFQFSSLSAQTPQYNYISNGKPVPDMIPLNSAGGRQPFQKSQWLYFPEDFGSITISNKVINKIYFEAAETRGPTTLEKLHVALGQDKSITTLNVSAWETGLTSVRDSAQLTIPTVLQRQWIVIELDEPFPYNPNFPLLVEVSSTSMQGGVDLISTGRSLKRGFSGNNQNYGETFDAIPNTSRSNLYSFGFDLVDPPVDNDIGVASVDSPFVFCGTGMQDVYVTVQNFGSNIVNSFELHWEVNGVAQTTVNSTATLGGFGSGLPSTAQLKLGSHNFQGFDVVKVYTAMPNGVSDAINNNDTIMKAVRSALNGTYTVNAGNPESLTNFNSLTSLSNTLNEVGVCGPVTINVANGFYNEALHLKEVQNTSAINHIVIDGGDSSQTIVSQDGSNSFSTLTIEETNHVKVQNMSFINTGSKGNAATFVNTMYDTLSNCATWVDSDASSKLYNLVFSGEATSNTQTKSHYNVIQNNSIIGGSVGIQLNANASEVGRYNQFYNNLIDSSRSGAFFVQQDSLNFNGNTVNTYDNNGYDAVKFEFVNNFQFKQNYVIAQNRGLWITNQKKFSSTERRNQIVNNMIFGKNASFPLVALRNVDSVDIWHNSIYCDGEFERNGAFNGVPGLEIANSAGNEVAGYDVRNNILTSKHGSALRVNPAGAADVNSIFSKLDYNIYYTYNNANSLQLGLNRYYTLATFKTAYPTLNSSSYQDDPEFVNLVNPNDLHIKGSYPDEKGDNSVGVVIDIDGDVRPSPSATFVDIGADEFFPSFCYPPRDLEIANITKSSIDISWERDTVNDAHKQFGYAVVPCGSSPYSTATILTNLDSVTVSGLSAGSCYELYVRDVCARADSSVWLAPKKFHTAYTIPYFEDYESFASNLTENPWPKGWSSYKNHSMLPSWSSMSGEATNQQPRGPSQDHTKGKNGDATGKYIYLGTTFGAGTANHTADFISPLIYVDSNLASFELSYWYHAYSSGIARMDVFIEHNGTERLVSSIDQNRQQRNKLDSWFKDSVIVAGYQGKIINVIFRGKNGNDARGNPSATGVIGIDDIAVNVGPTCPPPYDVVGINPTGTSIDLNWSSMGAAATLEYGKAGFTQGNGTTVKNTTSPFNITGLVPNVVYEVYIQDSCDVTDLSVVSGPFKFSIDTVNCDDFDNYTIGNIASRSTLFESWAGDPEDAEVTTEQANSAPNSLKIHNSGPNSESNLTANIGTYDSAKWVVAFDFYVPADHGGYYNILNNYNKGVDAVIAIEVQLDSSGVATVKEGTNGRATNGTDTIGNYNFNIGAWNTVEHIIDLDNDTAYLEVNGAPTNVGWRFSLDSLLNFGEQFNAVNFYSAANNSQTPLVYYDNFCVRAFSPVPYYPIGILNTEDANGVADSADLTAWTSGTVVGVDLNVGKGLGFTLIDMASGSQEGIYIHSDDNVNNYKVTEGDSLRVRGVVDQFNGLTQLAVHSIEVVSSGNAIPTPRVATALDASTESQYLEMKNFILLDPSEITPFSYNMRAYNGTDTITVRINNQTDVIDSLAVVGKTVVARDTICVLLGIGSQFDPNSPHIAGYQITPMRYSDLTICKDVTIGINEQSNASNELTFYPNPTTGSFTIATSGLENDNAIITIRDISGKVIVRENIINSSSAFKKNYSLEGQAKGLYLISIIDGENRINKKLILQ